jgi:GntR family transcriptional regulator/MocR family aminotransferase
MILAGQMVRPRSFPVALDPSASEPLFLQIVRAVSDDVLRGRLRPGQPLPGSRSLAAEIGVHRSTVVAAYGELVAQGWAVARPRGGTAIAATSPQVEPRRFSPRLPPRPGLPATPGFALSAWPAAIFKPHPSTSAPPGVLYLSAIPDVRLVQRTLLGRALRRVVRGQGQVLDYAADRRGHAGLREAVARMVSSARGLAATGEDVFITSGSQMALDLLGRALLGPGDGIAVEALGYRPAWGALQRAGARLFPIPLDGEGMQVEALLPLVQRRALRAVYVTPHHQYPTTALLSPRRRLALLDLARAHRLAIIEDDYDHEFHYQGRPVLPLASADRTGQVVYVGTLSKILAPGLRIGFVVAPAPVIDRLVHERALTDDHGTHIVEAAVAELLEDGEVQRHARRARRIYHRRRDALAAALGRHLGGALTFSVPPGGTSLWAEAAPDIDVERWGARGLAAGVLFRTGATFTFSGAPAPFLRLGFAACDEPELDLAARRLARALAESRRPSPAPRPRDGRRSDGAGALQGRRSP